MEIVFGSETETVHREGAILYKLDAARLMFSSGNFDEKKRMGELDCTGETVVDMFAGIGYFTLPLAKLAHAKRVIACEINPLAHSYLRQNLVLNRVESMVEPTWETTGPCPTRTWPTGSSWATSDQPRPACPRP